jgi:hypothetical protein
VKTQTTAEVVCEDTNNGRGHKQRHKDTNSGEKRHFFKLYEAHSALFLHLGQSLMRRPIEFSQNYFIFFADFSIKKTRNDFRVSFYA